MMNTIGIILLIILTLLLPVLAFVDYIRTTIRSWKNGGDWQYYMQDVIVVCWIFGIGIALLLILL